MYFGNLVTLPRKFLCNGNSDCQPENEDEMTECCTTAQINQNINNAQGTNAGQGIQGPPYLSNRTYVVI